MSPENRPITPPIGRSVVNGQTVPVFQMDNAFSDDTFRRARPLYMFGMDWYDEMKSENPDDEEKNPSDGEKARAYFVVKRKWIGRKIWLTQWTRTLLPGMEWGYQMV
ncbi:unnamed protein product [Clonostachys rosea f. rosea IK726]|uniref:Uncharacterized protein n=1 Tax=Clonostachys rosea f. rosea IK726 TaxID=1349383 RepID=A0ACA9TT62_BIOOC|nr:unnamed protein product [Clonostachys rosea f. rosea IK726]